jgi:hypothetical protein
LELLELLGPLGLLGLLELLGPLGLLDLLELLVWLSGSWKQCC